MKKYTACHICGKEVAYEDGGVIPGYCGNACHDEDMKEQTERQGYFSLFVPLQISQLYLGTL